MLCFLPHYCCYYTWNAKLWYFQYFNDVVRRDHFITRIPFVCKKRVGAPPGLPGIQLLFPIILSLASFNNSSPSHSTLTSGKTWNSASHAGDKKTFQSGTKGWNCVANFERNKWPNYNNVRISDHRYLLYL